MENSGKREGGSDQKCQHHPKNIIIFHVCSLSWPCEELDLADLLACGAMCSSVLVCNTAVQCPKYKFQGLWSF